MVPVRQYEAKKGVGGPKKHTKAENQAGSPSKKENYLCLVRLGGHGALGNA